MIDNLVRKIMRKPPLTEHEIAARHIRHLPEKDLMLFGLGFYLTAYVRPNQENKGISAQEMSDLLWDEIERRGLGERP